MSYDYRYQRTTTNRPGTRRYAPPPPPSRGSSSHHSVFGYWVPLVVTGTLALGGLAAWIWSERSDHDDDEYPHEKPPRPQPGMGQNYPTQGSQPYPGPQQGGSYQGPPPQGPMPPPPQGGEASSYYNTTTTTTTESRNVNGSQSQSQSQLADDGTWYGRMIKRTPSPQQFFDSASKQVSAGMAAAGAALGSIMEDSDEQGNGRRQSKRRTEEQREEGFSDHERWSEEADERQQRTVSTVDTESERRADSAREKGKRGTRKAVAVVVSADTNADVYAEDEDAGYRTEHASILSHLPPVHNPSTTDLFVLIYSPGLKSLPPLNYQPNSTSNTPAVTPGSELQDPVSINTRGNTPVFNALYTQALSLVSTPTQILPFTTRDGYVHILRHLAPQLVYVSDVLSGDEGESISQLKGWVGHTILVAGDDGVGGLADTETETEAEDEGGQGRRMGKEGKGKQWWEEAGFVGLGKEVEVVDAGRVGEDWGRRVGGRE